MKKKDKEAGDKARAGVLLSTFIRSIAQEMISVEIDGHPGPQNVMKAEALARQIWDRALGEFTVFDKKTGDVRKLPADRAMIELIFDRMEGKAGSAEDTKQKSETIPAKMSRQNKERLNKLANQGD